MAISVGGKQGGPMSDIIVLLIIFMVITPLLQKGVDVVLPRAGNIQDREDEPQIPVVALKKDTTTYIGTERLDSQEELYPKLRERMRDIREGTRLVYLKADVMLPYSEVMKVMDICREAGVEEVALIAEQRAEGG